MAPPCSYCDRESKYSCPGCGVRTCSLTCFNKHKEATGCSGKSNVSLNKTEYLAKDQIDETEMQRDYNFLVNMDRKLHVSRDESDQTRIISTVKRQRRNPRSQGPQGFEFDDDSNVITRRGVRIRHLPLGMSRRLQNRSRFDKQKDAFYWTLEWVLVDDSFGEIDRFVGAKNDDSTSIQDLIPYRRFGKKLGLEDAEDSSDSSLRSRFKFYIISEEARNRVVRIPGDTPLAQALNERLFIEFPTIYATVSDQLHLKDKWIVDLSEDESDESSSDSSSSSSDSSDGSDESSSDDSDSSSSDSAPEQAASVRPEVAIDEDDDASYCPSESVP